MERRQLPKNREENVRVLPDGERRMSWDPQCYIVDFPPRLMMLAKYRTTAGGLFQDLNHAFDWDQTPEGFNFWSDVYCGVVPENLEEILTNFEQEHPEIRILLGDL